MTRAAPLTWDHIPVYARDAQIGVVVLGAARAREWCDIARALEKEGLPPVDRLMGGRYVPAVRRFLDRREGLEQAASPPRPDGVEDLSVWNTRRPRKTLARPV